MQNSAMLDSSLPTAVVCHDAGAANIVIANLLQSGRRDWRACMQGPARKSWENAFPDTVLYDSLEETLDGAALLISGTGWASNIEHLARKRAQELGIPCIAVVDHWVNYAERFVRAGEIVWPDEFWVTDEDALKIAHKTFPRQNIKLIENHYLEAELQAIGRAGKPDSAELLYVLEPARSDWGRGVEGEFQALDFFVKLLPKLGLPHDVTVRLRPHPSDPPDKYRSWIEAHSHLGVLEDTSPSLSDALGRACWVAGCETFALHVAILAGRTAFCTLPPWAPPCRLPHRDLIHIGNLYLS